LVIAGYILWMSFGLLRRTSVILMEGTPAGISIDAVKLAVEAIDGVLDMHHIHVWALDEHRRALEAHLVIAGDRSLSELEAFKAEVKRLLADRFEIVHSTLELEAAGTACRGC